MGFNYKTVGTMRFGVFDVFVDGLDIQVVPPRRENKVGTGHKGFVVEFDPTITMLEAASRRDFVINSMALNPLTMEIYDPFGGQTHIALKHLQATSSHFSEDPMRVLRGVQFAGRFNMNMGKSTVEMCQKMMLEYATLPKEAIFAEWWKWASKSKVPSRGLEVLFQSGWISLYSELLGLVDLPQDHRFHPEGWNISPVSEPPSFLYIASVTKSNGRNNGLGTFREFVSGATAHNTVIPGGSSASLAKPRIYPEIDSLSSANATRPDNFATSQKTPIAIEAHPIRLVWKFGGTAISTDKVIGIVFPVQLSRVISIMNSAIDDLEVLRKIVHPIMVYVMDMLPSLKGATEFHFGDETMNGNSLSIMPSKIGVHISRVVIEAKTSSVYDNILFYVDLSIKTDIDAHDISPSNKCSTCAPIVYHEFYEITNGSAWKHVGYAVDRAAHIAVRDHLSEEDRGILVMAALLHDIGKSITTTFKNGHIVSPAHPEMGEPLASDFLKSIGFPFAKDGPSLLTKKILKLVRCHMRHLNMPSRRSALRLARDVYPSGINMLVRLMEADHSARPPLQGGVPKNAMELFAFASMLDADKEPVSSILKGRDLIALGMKEGPSIGEILKMAYEAQLEEYFFDYDGGIEWVKLQLKGPK